MATDRDKCNCYFSACYFMTHCQTLQVFLDTSQVLFHKNNKMYLSFTTHYLVVTKLRERLSVSRGTKQNFDTKI